MARSALRPAEVDAFRRRLAAAATRLFARHGYAAVTMRAVAAELGVSAMTPYRYVAGKAGLVALVRAAAFTRFAAALAVAEPDASGAPLPRLRQLKAAYLRFALAHPDDYRVMFELRAPDDDTRWPELERASAAAFAHLQGAVDAAIAAGELAGEPRSLAQLLWASTHGLVALHLAGKLSGRAFARLAAIDHELAGFRPAGSPTPRRRRS